MQALLNDLKYAAAILLKAETKTVTKQHQHKRPCLIKLLRDKTLSLPSELSVVLLKLRETYQSIAQVKESNKVNEVLDLCRLRSRRLKVLMDTRKNRGCKRDTQGQREFPPPSRVSIAHVNIMHPVLSHILFSSAF